MEQETGLNTLWNTIKEGFLETYTFSEHNIFLTPAMNGLLLEVIVFIFIIFGYRFFKNSNIMILFEFAFQKILEFFEDILDIKEKKWIKLYVTLLFFIILVSNLLSLLLEFISPVIGNNAEGDAIVEEFIKLPTADINFNLAMAIIGVIIVILEQFKYLGFFKALYEYVPILGKNYIPYERGNLPKYIDIPVFLLIKTFDIIISLFLGLLDIVGHAAKIISLSFRLFGNMISGGLLLGMLYGGLALLTGFISEWAFGANINFPILVPDIIYAQELLVALIQALVFPLLIAIFIKVAKTD